MASEIRVNSLTNRSGLSTVTIADTGVVVAGMVTATDAIFTGDITVANGSFSGNVSVGGTLTYEDVTNIDSVGIVTARSGLHVTGGNLLVGRTTDYWSSRSIVQEDKNGRTHLLVKNDNNHASASAGITLNAFGNSWAIDCGSHPNNTNALTFGLDASLGSPAEKLRITSAGNVGIGLTNPDWHLDIKSTSVNAVVRLKSSGSTNGGQLQVNSDDLILRNRDAGELQLWTNDSKKLTITSAGDLFVAGTGGMNTTQLPNGSTINVNGTSSNDGLSVIRYSTGYGAYGLNIGRSKSGTLGTNAAVTNGNDLGHISFYGADGTDFNMAAQITSQVDGTPSDGTDMPGRLIFKTSSEGSATPTERLRITSAGKLTVTPADTTSSYATTDGGIDIAQTISSTGTSASQSIGIQFSLTKTGQTGAIAEIGAIREGSGLSGLVFRTRDNSTGRNERLRITSGGNIGIDCTPNDHNSFTRALDVNGPSGAAVYMRTNDSTSNCLIVGNYGSEAYINNVANGNIRFYTQGTERFRIQNDGNVIPLSNGAHNLGLSGNKWNKVWTNYVRYGTRSATYERTLTATSNGSGDLTFECGVLWLVDDSSFEVLVHIDRTGTHNSIAARYKFYGSKVSGFGTQGTYRSDTSNFYIISPMSNPVIDSYTPSGHGTSHGTRIRHTSAVANAEYRITMLINWVGQREVT